MSIEDHSGAMLPGPTPLGESVCVREGDLRVKRGGLCVEWPNGSVRRRVRDGSCLVCEALTE